MVVSSFGLFHFRSLSTYQVLKLRWATTVIRNNPVSILDSIQDFMIRTCPLSTHMNKFQIMSLFAISKISADALAKNV